MHKVRNDHQPTDKLNIATISQQAYLAQTVSIYSTCVEYTLSWWGIVPLCHHTSSAVLAICVEYSVGKWGR